MEQVLFGGSWAQLDSIQFEYNTLVGFGQWTDSAFSNDKLISANGIIKNLRVRLAGAPGVGTHWDFTLYVNGAPSALTLEISDAATSGNNMVNEIVVAPDDVVTLRSDPDNSPQQETCVWTSVFEGATAKESLIMGGSNEYLGDSTEYYMVMGGYTDFSVTENDFRQVVPTAGTIKDFYVRLSKIAGAPGNGYRFTVRLNGATVAQSLVAEVLGSIKTGNDLIHNLAVIAGDILTLLIEPVGTPSTFVKVTWGMTFEADIDGESIVLGGAKDDLSSSLTEYNFAQCPADELWTATEEWMYQLGQVCTLKKLNILLSAAPGAGKKYDFTLRINVADSNVVATVDEGNTTGNSAALEVDVALDEYVDLQCAPDGTPDVVDAYWGFVSYIEPEAAKVVGPFPTFFRS